MSMILDALRKSEAERRRADVPDLFDEAPVAAPVRAAGPPRAWLWAVAAIAVLLAVAYALRAARDTDASAGNPAAVDATTAVAAPGTARADVANAAEAIASSTAPLPATPVVPAPMPAMPAASAPALTGAPEAAAEVPAPASASDPVPAPVRAAQAPAVPPPAPIVATAPRPEPAPLLVMPSTRAPGGALTRAPASTPDTAPAAATFTSPTSPLRLSDLSIEERQQLPALKISMLMWNPAPDRRFAIVDGNRVSEGDRVGDAVVDAITEDGVVLGWQGRRLKVPIR